MKVAAFLFAVVFSSHAAVITFNNLASTNMANNSYQSTQTGFKYTGFFGSTAPVNGFTFTPDGVAGNYRNEYVMQSG